jgi:hypothetical protein
MHFPKNFNGVAVNENVHNLGLGTMGQKTAIDSVNLLFLINSSIGLIGRI